MTRSSRLALAAVALVLATNASVAQLNTPSSRIVAIGDVHGAYDPFVAILTKAGLIDAEQTWTGGRTTLVVTGDYTDRGAEVKQVLDLLMTVDERARAGGGLAVILLGNHEVLNIIGDMRYITPEICKPFVDGQSEERRENAWKQYETLVAGRRRVRNKLPKAYEHTRESWMAAHPPGWLEYREAIGPRGRYGKWLRGKSIAASIDGTIFMHAGISPNHSATVDDVNARARQEMARYEAYLQRLVDRRMALSYFTLPDVLEISAVEIQAANAIMDAAAAKFETPDLSAFDAPALREAFNILKMGEWSLLAGEGPLWFRGYATWPEDGMARAKVGALLDKLRVQRIVVGHTPMADSRIRPRFQGRVFLIDTGMLATVYNGRPSALEIRGSEINAIYEDGVVPLTPATTPAIAFAR